MANITPNITKTVEKNPVPQRAKRVLGTSTVTADFSLPIRKESRNQRKTAGEGKEH